jgi:carboxyl-terminal processing protease
MTAHSLSVGRALAAAALAWTALTMACGGGPTTPSGPFSGETAVRGLVEQIIDTMEQQSFKRAAVDWTALRTQVLAKAAGVTRIFDAYPAIQLAFQLLNDPHSRYVSFTGTTIRYSTLDCSTAGASIPSLPANIGYVQVRSTGGTTAEAYAGAMHEVIRAADRDDTIGWVVDLRGNGGGSTYAMVAGVGPILGEGPAGSFINPDGVRTEWGYRSGAPGVTGATSNGTVVVVPSTVYQLRRPDPPVVVLSDRANSSAGESTLISFIARPNTRILGTPSCGLSQGVAGLPMRDGATLWLARSIMADRTTRPYGGTVMPDEVITDEAALFARAIAWLSGNR